MDREAYPSDVSDEEWVFVVLYLTLMREDAPQREHKLREVFNRLRYIVSTGAQWRMMPNDLPPWHTVYQHIQRWQKADVFETLVRDYERLSDTLVGLHFIAFAMLLVQRSVPTLSESS
jgi:transposase